MYRAYKAIFSAAVWSSGRRGGHRAIGGNMSHEFQVLAETGEDAIAACKPV